MWMLWMHCIPFLIFTITNNVNLAYSIHDNWYFICLTLTIYVDFPWVLYFLYIVCLYSSEVDKVNNRKGHILNGTLILNNSFLFFTGILCLPGGLSRWSWWPRSQQSLLWFSKMAAAHAGNVTLWDKGKLVWAECSPLSFWDRMLWNDPAHNI